MSNLRLPDVTPRSSRASGDRWLFGYADIVTLLFASFAALYAARLVPAAAPASPGTSDVAPAFHSGQRWLEQQIGALRVRESEIRIDVLSGRTGTVISLAEAGTFAPGQAELTPAALRVIGQLAELLRDRPQVIRVEGHTDDLPINNQRYASNWELSAARATRVVQWLIEYGGIVPERLSVAGYAEYRPRLAGTTDVARARNRRVDIVVLDRTAAQDDGTPADYHGVRARPSGGE